jgi:peptide/nickel transport system substrate-binding protein
MDRSGDRSGDRSRPHQRTSGAWRGSLLAALLAWVIVGCTPAGPMQSSAPQAEPPRGSDAPRSLVVAFRFEPTDLSAKIAKTGSNGNGVALFNAALAVVDNASTPRPHLAEALPALNTDSWRLSPDGRMETTYRLRPGLTWHDGAPLTADDFAFAYRVYLAPTLAVFLPNPQDQIDDITAVDPRTLLIRWRSTYPEAGALDQGKLDPLPRHLLGEGFAALEQDPSTRDAFLNLPFWNVEYVGVGPFRLTRWDPGTEIEMAAFDGHSLGRPKIDRLILRLIPDENTVLTNVLSGTVQFTQYFTLRFEHGQVLRREWVPEGKGVVLLDPSSTPLSVVQFRPEFLKAPGLLDVRVRRALAHSIDRQTLQDGLFEGEGVIANTYVLPHDPFFPDVDRTIVKYPYDPSRTEQLMTEAGFTRDRDGLFANLAGERFAPEFQAQSGSQFERHQAVMENTWRRAGIEVKPTILAANVSRDNFIRASFPGLGHSGSGEMGRVFISAQIGSEANRWNGSNRGGWFNAEYDRLWDAYNSTLDRSERGRHLAAKARVVSEELPAYVLYYNFNLLVHAAALRGPTIAAPESTNFWNVHEWELR